jgi:SPOR domain
MSGSALMAPQVNLDEFERRLRAAGSPVGPQEDPLDELARLVGLDSRESRPPQRVVGFPPRAEAPRMPLVNPLHVEDVEQQIGEDEHLFPESAAPTIEDASLRGSLDDLAHAQYEPAEARPHEISAPSQPRPAPRRSRRVALTMGALVLVGAGGLAATWVVKGAPGLPKIPPVIMAVVGPTKIQPPTQDTIASPSDSASVLLKDQKGKSDPIKLVSSEEQPVDLQQQAKPLQVAAASPAPMVPATPAPMTDSSIAASAAPAASGPVPTIVSPTRSIALTSVGPTAAPAAPAPFPEPKRVKTVSVRPDGSVISSGSESVADAGPAAAPPANPSVSEALPDATPQPANPPIPRARPAFDASAGSAAQPATPKLDLPTKLAPKSTARVPIAKTDTTVASGPAQTQAPEAPAPQQKTPLQAVPDLFQSVAKAVTGQSQTQVAAADPVATATTTGSGSYSVQLAAPPTDKEAQNAAAHLQNKYASQLGGMQPTIHQADVNGHTIYRVRLSGMAKADAVTLCQKLKASGGEAACFVARD